jgi:hypothetical protein
MEGRVLSSSGQVRETLSRSYINNYKTSIGIKCEDIS